VSSRTCRGVEEINTMLLSIYSRRKDQKKAFWLLLLLYACAHRDAGEDLGGFIYINTLVLSLSFKNLSCHQIYLLEVDFHTRTVG